MEVCPPACDIAEVRLESSDLMSNPHIAAAHLTPPVSPAFDGTAAHSTSLFSDARAVALAATLVGFSAAAAAAAGVAQPMAAAAPTASRLVAVASALSSSGRPRRTVKPKTFESPDLEEEEEDNDYSDGDLASSSSRKRKRSVRLKESRRDVRAAKQRPINSQRTGGYTYAQMIEDAIMSAPDRKMFLCEIYSYLREHFPALQTGSEQGWKNSVRHNLSIHSQFQRVEAEYGDRRRDILGRSKGSAGFWTVVVDDRRRSEVRRASTGSRFEDDDEDEDVLDNAEEEEEEDAAPRTGYGQMDVDEDVAEHAEQDKDDVHPARRQYHSTPREMSESDGAEGEEEECGGAAAMMAAAAVLATPKREIGDDGRACVMSPVNTKGGNAESIAKILLQLSSASMA